jgi:hypothetical protein
MITEIDSCKWVVPDFLLSRQQATEEGLLVDLTPWTRTLGFRFPVACSAEVWNQLLPDREIGQAIHRDHQRIRMMLKMLRSKIRSLSRSAVHDRINFYLLFGSSEPPQRIKLTAFCGPGDNGEPVLTVLPCDQPGTNNGI